MEIHCMILVDGGFGWSLTEQCALIHKATQTFYQAQQYSPVTHFTQHTLLQYKTYKSSKWLQETEHLTLLIIWIISPSLKLSSSFTPSWGNIVLQYSLAETKQHIMTSHSMGTKVLKLTLLFESRAQYSYCNHSSTAAIQHYSIHSVIQDRRKTRS